MLTFLNVEDTNCAFCQRAGRAALLADPLVHSVTIDANAKCWNVVHDFPDENGVFSVLQKSMYGWDVAENGEVEMTPIRLGPDDACPLHSGRESPGSA